MNNLLLVSKSEAGIIIPVAFILAALAIDAWIKDRKKKKNNDDIDDPTESFY